MNKLPNLKSTEGPSFRNEELQRSFQANGYVVLPEGVAEGQINNLIMYWLKFKEQYISTFYRSTIELSDIEHRRDANTLFKEATADIAAKYLLGYEQFYGGYGVKFSTGENSILNAHQDMTMIPYEGNRTGLTLWFSLMDVVEANGCLQVLPESHLYNRLPRGAGGPFAYHQHAKTIDNLMVSIPTRKGEVVIMDQALIHRSGANTSGYVRVAAMGMFKPIEDRLVYYNRIPQQDEVQLEVFSVSDDFYLSHKLLTRPVGYVANGMIQENTTPYLWFAENTTIADS